MKKKIYGIVGATASGKSALGIALAKRKNCNILCCDSMQIYREMSIGTAKPTKEEQSAVKHLLFDFISPFDAYSVSDYCRDAQNAVKLTISEDKTPLFVGGTGLYLDAFLRGGLPETAPTEEHLRTELLHFAEEKGNHALWERLKAVDEESADAIHENNVRRVARALEIFLLTNKPKSVWDRESREGECRFDATIFGIAYHSKDTLQKRMDLRVENMMRDGLLDETERLLRMGVFEKNQTASQAIGYKELLPYLKGEMSLEECTEQLKIATHQYGKRQMTWFRAKNYIHWIYADREDGTLRDFAELTEEAEKIWEGIC